MTPIDSCPLIDEVMSKQFPLGVIKDVPAEASKARKEGEQKP